MLDQLKQVINAEDTVLFIGSGISRWSNLPSWEGLLRQLADYLDRNGRNGDIVRIEMTRDLLLAASYGFDQLTPYELGQFMQSACLANSAVPHGVHERIVNLPPRCFVTTNYDKLIEDSFRRWRPMRPIKMITNRQQVDVANLLSLRAVDFVFKPHGDIDDSESIIITREHYRKLLDGGEYKHALKALEMLLATRRVVYVGFGLRDLDFLLLRDVLANSFRGGIRDHFSIMPDVSEHERVFWRKNYGIHLVSYPVAREGASEDHSALLTLLDDLRQLPPSGVSQSARDRSSDLLELLRLAHSQMQFTELQPNFPLRVHRAAPAVNFGMLSSDPFNHAIASDFLEAGPKHAVLIGLPGAGKSYRLHQAAASLASKVHQACLANDTQWPDITIPIFADLKLYRGSLIELLESNLPESLRFEALASQYRVKIFLDSFNEISRDQLEKGAFETDFAKFFARFSKVSVVIASRTNDGLRNLKIPEYALDEIKGSFVDEYLSSKEVELTSHFKSEMRKVLQRPFYFQLAYTGVVPLSSTTRPRDIYRTILQHTETQFSQKFGYTFRLTDALSVAAYQALNLGEEAMPVSIVAQTLANTAQEDGLSALDEMTIVNWLVSRDLLLSYSGSRVSFFHQSMTEYLASVEFARRFRDEPRYLAEKLQLRRWDQALFLGLNQLQEAYASSFIDEVISTDLILAMRAIKYLEADRQQVVDRVLAEIPKRTDILKKSDPEFVADWEIERALEDMPVTTADEGRLRVIANTNGRVAAAAALRLFTVLPDKELAKKEMLALLSNHRKDYNYCSKLGKGLRHCICEEDLSELAALADSIDDETAKGDDVSGFGLVEGVSSLLKNLNLKTVSAFFLPMADEKISAARAAVLSGVLRRWHTQEALDLSLLLFRKGLESALATMCLVYGPRGDNELSWGRVDKEDVRRIITSIDEREANAWAIDVLLAICETRPEFIGLLLHKAEEERGIRRAAVLYAARADRSVVISALEDLLEVGDEALSAEPLKLLSRISLDWRGHEGLLLRLLRMRHAKFAWRLLEGVDQLGEVELHDVEWWLAWLSDIEEPEEHWWLTHRLAGFFTQYLTASTRRALLGEFNRKGSKYRLLLATRILVTRRDLTTDDFSDDAIAFLLSELPKLAPRISLDGDLLGRTATESFVAERMLPIFASSKEPARTYFKRVLRETARRHGRRYLSDRDLMEQLTPGDSS